jgi:hypothetical protein
VLVHSRRYVIDTGMVKQKAFNPRTQLDTLRVKPISQAQAGDSSEMPIFRAQLNVPHGSLFVKGGRRIRLPTPIELLYALLRNFCLL